MNRFLAALQFLTTIPVPGKHRFTPEEVGRSAGYFPVIGIIIGLILVGLSGLFSLILPAAIARSLLILFMVVISGGMHADGFIDTCDGIGGRKPAEDRWQVMKDSRSGSFGIVGIVLLLLVKFASLVSIPDSSLMVTLVLMPVLSRWAMAYAIFIYRYAKPSGLGKAFKQGTSWPRFTMATIVAAVVALFIGQLIGLAIMFVVWLVTVVMAAYFKSKFAGLTGDNYGAINEVAEVSVLIFINLLAGLGLLLADLGLF